MRARPVARGGSTLSTCRLNYRPFGFLCKTSHGVYCAGRRQDTPPHRFATEMVDGSAPVSASEANAPNATVEASAEISAIAHSPARPSTAQRSSLRGAVDAVRRRRASSAQARRSVVQASRRQSLGAGPPASAPHAARAPTAEEELEQASSLWKKANEKRKTLAYAQAFFTEPWVRELRPARHDSLKLGQGRTMSDKWRKIRDASSTAAQLNQQRLKVRAAHAAQVEIHSADGELEGDPMFHTRECWERRMRLWSNPQVIEELHAWWRMLRTTFA